MTGPAADPQHSRFLDGGGEMGALLRGFDWAAHPLGDPARWPAALKLATSLCLHSRFPTAIYWGGDLRMIYNDAWISVAQERHPAALGRAGATVWSDIWAVVGPQLDAVVASGTGFAAYGQRLVMVRDGVPTTTYWNYSFSPLRDAAGAVCGVFSQGNDVTPQVLGEQALRRANAERDFILSLTERQRVQADADDVMQLTAEALGRYLAVDRAGFFRVLPGDMIEYGACWVGGALPPLTGTIPSDAFGSEPGRSMRSGNTLAFGHPDDPDAPDAAALAVTGTSAGISVPLVRGGAWQGAFYISNVAARGWTRDEIALVEEVAELSWDAVARVAATARLQALNADLAGEIVARTAERDQLWEVSNDLLGIAERDGRWVAVNPAWERALGWPADDIVGRDSQWLRHPDDRGRAAEIAGGGETHRLEKRLRTRDGAYRTFAWQTTLVGERLYTNARDVTEERRQQAALIAAEKRTRMVLEAMDGMGVWTYDIAADRFESDAGFAALYGFTAEEIRRGIGLTDVAARIHPDDRPALRAEHARARVSDEDGASEYRLRLPDGTLRWIMSRTHVMHDASGRREQIIGVGVDVTRQRELEERLRQAQKMEAVGQLTGGLAHDFNNLLAGISGALELMQVRLTQGRTGELPRYIGAAQTAAQRAAALTHRLLAFSRRQPLDPRPVDVARLIRGMEELLRGTLGPAVTVELHTDPASWPILADANQLENALLNLCINARDAMPDGGVVTITTENDWLDAADAAARDLPAGAYLSLCVADTGTGMSPDTIARAFDPFFTTKPIGQGTGLGLSMIYGFVRQSGGHVQIHSVLGEGTRMCLHLPRHEGTAGAATERAAAAPLPAGDGETVLVVDDEPTLRMLVGEILGELGYRTLEAKTGAEALVLIEGDARIDLLVTDVGLPGGIDGRQVADCARAARPGLPVLFITGYAENAVVGNGPLEPGMALIAKPFAIDALAARVRAMLGDG